MDEGQEPLVSVVIPALDGGATLGRTLDALKRQRLDGAFEVIVVDNGSSDDTYELAAAAGPPIKVVRNEDTLGAGAARNTGVNAAVAPIIAFTDADCFPAPTWLAAGLAAIERADLVQGVVHADPEAPRTPFDRTVVVTEANGYFQTANLFVRREVFDSVGGFEDLIVERGGDAPFGWRAPSNGRPSVPARRPVGEDTLFGWSARRVGARTDFASDAVVHHAVFPGTAGEWIRYQWWKRHAPALVERIPELRDELLFQRLFLDRRSAGFDLAVASVLTAAATRRRAPLLGILPYARWVYAESRQHGARGGATFAAATVGADAMSLAALVVGSIAWRKPVI